MPHQRPGGGTEAFIDMCITLLIFFLFLFAMVCLFVCFLDCATADIERLMGIDRNGVCRQAALFLLRMKEKNLVTQTAVDELIDGTSSIFDHTFSMLRAGIREKLATSGVDVGPLELDSVFNELCDPFDGLKTKHFQEKYFKDSLRLIVSQFTWSLSITFVFRCCI